MIRRCASVVVLLLWLASVSRASTPCQCEHVRPPRCADPTAKRRITVHIDLTVVNDTVEVVTQSGPYQVPVADLDGKLILFLFMPRGEVFQGFLEEAVADSITLGTMQGAQAMITTNAAFVPGEYELLLFVDAAPGGGLGPNRGDLAAFDNGMCDPTGVSIRVPVGCEDTTVTLVNRNFIIF